MSDQKFDLISIDGSWGSEELSRIDIVNHFSEILKEDFAIILDDYDRIGEQKLIIICR